MKYCTICGAEIADEAVVCVHCGCAVQPLNTNVSTNTETSALKIVAKVFMIIGCVASAFFFLFPLAWTIPMTVSYCRSIENRQPVSVGFKVCTLIFVNAVAGILMLCDNDSKS